MLSVYTRHYPPCPHIFVTSAKRYVTRWTCLGHTKHDLAV